MSKSNDPINYDELRELSEGSWSYPSVYGKSEVDDLVMRVKSELVSSAPETLNTLDELAAALGDDANFAATVAKNIGDISIALDNIIAIQNELIGGGSA